jgi:hypothetical protein
LPACLLSSASPLRLSSVTTAVSSTITLPIPSFSLGVSSSACLVCIPLPRMARLSA